MNKRITSLLGILILMSAALAFGQQKQVTADLKQFKVVVTNGVESLKPADTVKPGEVIEYVATYQNNGKEPVKNVVGTIPVPSGMEFTPDAKLKAPDAAAASDGKFGSLPLKHKVTKNGVEVDEVLPYSAYRSLRWNLGTLAPGQKVEVKARVKVSAH